MLPAPSSDGRFECPCPLLSCPSRSCSAPWHTPRSHLLVLGSECSRLGLLRQLPVVVGELVGQYAQLIWVGGGFGDLPMEEEQEVEGPYAGTGKQGGWLPCLGGRHHFL